MWRCLSSYSLFFWLLAHVFEASYWYNRNLVIIANIERQTIRTEDLKEIHYYFGKHRHIGSMIYHLRVQFVFGLLMGVLLLSYHLSFASGGSAAAGPDLPTEGYGVVTPAHSLLMHR